jgi:prepilin-type N-terminal cleavage/methylation domain-containing protein
MEPNVKHERNQASARRRAFTLIELVVALTLGAILLVSIGGILRQAFNDWNLARREMAQGLGLMELRDQIARDLTNARRVRIGRDRLELEGFLYREPITLTNCQRLATVTYEIRRRGDLGMLVRVQSQNQGELAVFRKAEAEILYIGAFQMMATSDNVESGSVAVESSISQAQLPKSPGAIKLVVLDQRGNVLVSLSHLRLGSAS